jgi:endonuclease/exonuclease/phosphatase family metal-dependent hydrolase
VLERCAGLREVFVDAYGRAARTYPARFPMLQLDRIYSRSMRHHAPLALPAQPWDRLSDHTPIAAEIQL